MATLNDSSVLNAGEKVHDSILMPAMAILGSFFSWLHETATNAATAMKSDFKKYLFIALCLFQDYTCCAVWIIWRIFSVELSVRVKSPPKLSGVNDTPSLYTISDWMV